MARRTTSKSTRPKAGTRRRATPVGTRANREAAWRRLFDHVADTIAKRTEPPTDSEIKMLLLIDDRLAQIGNGQAETTNGHADDAHGDTEKDAAIKRLARYRVTK